MIYGRVPPQATDLEEAILGASMLEKGAFDLVLEILSAESFYLDAHQRVFRAMQHLAQRSHTIDILTVVEQLRKSEELELVGGPYFVTKLTNTVVSSANIEAHSRIVQQKFIQREVIRVCGQMISKAWEDSTDALELLEETEKNVMNIGMNNLSSGTVAMDQVLMDAVTQIEKFRTQGSPITGVPSGYSELDRATRGWQPENLIIIAARPSVGKTAFALNLIRNAALNKEKPTPVAVWSLEMSVVELALRMLSAESEVWLHRIQTGNLEEIHMKEIYDRGVRKLAEAKVFFDDSSNITISRFRAKARKLKKKHDIGLIVVDYLQLMSGDKDRGNREQEISTISRSMKQLAKELQIPIIALSQLSRDVEKRTGANKKPQLSDLRESGAIEQDADVVIFLWRPSDEEMEEDASLTTRRHLRIAKQRSGVLAAMDFDFKNNIQLFQPMSADTAGGKWKKVKLDNPAQKSFYETDNDDLPF